MLSNNVWFLMHSVDKECNSISSQ